MTVEDVILNGRDEHPSLHELWTPDKPVMRFLTRLQQRILAKIADFKRDALQTVQTIELPLGDFSAGATVNAHLLIHGGDVIFTNTNTDPERLRLVSFRERLDRYRFRWGAYIQGTTMKLLGEEADWEDVDKIDLYYFPEGNAFTAKGDSFQIPGQALDFTTAATAAFLARRAAAYPDASIDPRDFAARAQLAEEEYLDQVTGRKRASVSTVREVF